MKKPCIQCNEDCEILAVKLGDFATLTYLRACGDKCMFMLAYEFLHEMYEHKSFINHLFKLQNEEDKEERNRHQDEATKRFLEDMRKDLKENPTILIKPAPQYILDMFKYRPPHHEIFEDES